MNRFIFQSVVMILCVILQLIIAPFFQPLGFKLNWVLLILIYFSLKPSEHWLPVLGMFSGLFCDAISHGMLGLYGFSFMIMVIFTKWISTWFHSKSIIFIMFSVFIISTLEGSLVITLINFKEPEFLWSWNWFNNILPLSFLHACSAPLLFPTLRLLENFFQQENI